MVEDKQKICGLFIPVLREMNGFRNILKLDYWKDREIVYIIFATGDQMVVDAGGTAAEMIEDIMKIIQKERLHKPGKAKALSQINI